MGNSLLVHYRNPALTSFIEKHCLDSESAVFGWSQGELVGKRMFGSLLRIYLEGIGYIFLKRYDYPGVITRFKENLIGSRAYREWLNSVRMKELGILQPEIVIVATRKKHWFTTGSILITREVPYAQSLKQLLTSSIECLSERFLEKLAISLINMICVMHRGGFCHWDLKPRNILVSILNDRLKLFPIDSTNGRSMNPLNRRHCVHRDYRFLLDAPYLGPMIAKQLRLVRKGKI